MNNKYCPNLRPEFPFLLRRSQTSSRFLKYLAILVGILVVMNLFLAPKTARAINPSPLQTYYLTMPEDDTLDMFYDNGAGNTALSPVRSVTYITIGTDGTLIYYDQWEDGSYDADIANPGSNVYNAAANPDGTQVWGDGILGNGCPPSIDNTPNPCLTPDDDVFENGDVIVLDNDVTVAGAPGGPYSRNLAQIFYDGRDKFGATLPVAVARAIWPSVPGSLMAGGVEVLETNRLGTSYTSPVGEDTTTATAAFEDVRWFILATGASTIDVDANGDGDLIDVNDLDGFALAAGAKISVDGIQEGATLNVVSGAPVSIDVVTSDIGSTYEFRWFSLLPDNSWRNDYYSPIGTAPQGNNAGCSEVWLFNPGNSPITVFYDFVGGGTPDGSVTVPAGGTAVSPRVLYNTGAHIYTASQTDVFLPFSITDCSQQTASGQINDWGAPLFPTDQLTPEVLVGWAPGCTNESYQGVCLDASSTSRTDSRSVIWLTPLANTTLFVDKDGSGITCTSSTTATGAEQTINATALASYRVDHDPTSRAFVHDNFSIQAYNNNTGNGATFTGVTQSTWASNWTETGDDGAANAGAIWITGGALQFRDNGGDETNISIQRSRNLSGQFFSRLSFKVQFAGNYNSDDALAVEVSPDGGTTWFTLEEIEGPISYPATTQLASKVYRISPYNSANTAIRFRTVGNLEAGDTWSIDEVHIDNAPDGDFDMTGAYIRTCNEVAFSAAYGQDPALSFSGDDEAPDLGTFVPPYGAQIAMTKVANSAYVSSGDLITYQYEVRSILGTTVNNVRIEDDLCEPETYISGDTDTDGLLEPGETWVYECTTELFVDTTNTAYACALLGSGEICSVPDQATVAVRSAVGDYVWVDEDGDGDQDAGEPGIPNVLVTLQGTDVSGNPVSLTTYTDANGRYLFPDVPPSNASGYTITIDTNTLPAGLAANPSYDEDGTGTPHTSSLILNSETEYLSADFGYNWAAPGDTNGNTGTGAIGDRVWIDADGDGLEDPEEPGFYNATVELLTPGPDGILGTVDDIVAATTTTDYNGSYIFDNLDAGAYTVRVTPPTGYTQTGDPDQPGVTCTTCDTQTTTPILLAPGDVYLNADFGFQPDAGNGATIGDTLWVDANLDNTQDGSEPVLPGVTVSLIRDLNGNGQWDAGEPIIATDVTDANGQYLFNGMPVADGTGTDDYLVWVNDTANVLQGLTATYDADGSSPASGLVTGLGISAVADLTPAGNFDQDFAYVPSNHQSGEGLIGDTVWLDTDNDGSFDPGEGLEGVLVSLVDNNGNIITRVRTNENGQYFFGGLPAGTYTVQVDYNTLPNGGLGLTNFSDPDGGAIHESTLTLTAGEINLNQDFGYNAAAPNTIGGTLWEDSDADGTQDGGETTVFSGVTIGLYVDTNLNGILDNEDRLVGTDTTDGSGSYSFTNLPDATYFVDVIDDANVLNGYWHADGPNDGADGNSQIDSYTVSVSGGETNTTGDFGYYRDPASIGDFVWDDLDRDGVQDVGEPGIADAEVQLTITWPGGGTTILTTQTDANGFYSFGNLLLDEDFNGAGGGEPTFEVAFIPPGTYAPTAEDQGGNDDLDSDGLSEPAAPVQGEAITNIDSGFKQVVQIGDTLWYDWDGDGVQDADEPGIAGVVVELDNGSCTVGGDCPTATTDANGNYFFDDLLPGTYTVLVQTSTLPAGVAQTGDPDQPGVTCTACDNASTIVATAPGTYDTLDFGYQGTGSISDYVWNDLDGDGVQDGGESGIGGVTVWVDLDNDGIQDPNEPSDVTDDNGAYYIGGLPAGTYTVRTAGAPISGATPTYDLDGPGTANVASVALSAGEDRSDVDWGYQFAALSIAKTSDAVGTVNPGDTIEYTLVIRNNTASQHTGIVISDTLPAGTTYVANSASATGYIISSESVRDEFSTQAYDNNDGTVNWATDWIENDPAGSSGPIGDYVGITTGGRLFFHWAWVGDERIERSINLGNALNATLTFDWETVGLDTNELIAVRVSTDGTNFTTLATYGGTQTGSASLSLASYLTSNTIIRFEAPPGSTDWESGEYAYFDNVQVAYTEQSNLATNPGGSPPVLVAAVDGYSLQPGQTMTVTFQVTVNDPVPNGLASIDNTASVVSDQQLTPMYDTVSDDLTTASIGDRVWSDLNGDGVQDGGEVGIAGATVELYDASNNLVATTTTDSNGDYLFSDLVSGDYTVRVTAPGGWRATYDEDSGTTSPDSQTAVTVNSGDNHVTADFGFEPALAVGGTVWNDQDDNDGSAVGDPGIANVTVELWSVDANGDPLARLATTVSNANGGYLFNGLDAGDYVIIVPNSPPGFSRSVAGNPDPDNDVDNDDNGGPTDGVPNGSGPVQSLPITLEPMDGSYNGQEPDTDGDSNRSNLTVDFGYSNDPTAVSLQTFTAAAKSPLLALAAASLLAIAALGIFFARRRTR